MPAAGAEAGIGEMSGPGIETGGVTDVGRRREHNEDAWTVFPVAGEASREAGRLVCVVADGMGGHLAGEVASARAVETIERELRAAEPGDPAVALRSALEQANAAIWSEARDDPAKAGMGTTVVCAIVDSTAGAACGARAWLANVGDSPAFLIAADGTAARQLTRDHSWVAEQVAAGDLRPEEAESHPYRSILTRCLGTEPAVEVDLYEPIDLQPGDSLVLCSDGLTEHVGAEEIAPIVARSAGPEVAARALVDLANKRGGRDNTTVVIARLGK